MSDPERPRRAAIYARISSNPRQEDEKLERQITRCLKLVDAREYEVVLDAETGGHFMDDDTSAYKGKTERPAYKRLVRAVESGEVDVVVTWATDRMLRTVGEMVTFIAKAERGKDDWASIDAVQGGNLELASPSGRMVAKILASVAEHEVEHKAERQKVHVETAIAAGRSVGGPVPFGWKRDGDDKTKPWLKHEEEAAAVLQAIRDRIERPDEVTLSAIAARWNKAGFRTRRTENDPKGHLWTQNAVRKVLVRPMNAGLQSRNVVTEDGRRTERKEIVEGVKTVWPAICTVKEWEEATKDAASRARPGRPQRVLLSNLMLCAACGTKVLGTAAGENAWYRCQNRSCGKAVPRDVADRIVRSAVRDRLASGAPAELGPSDLRLTRARELHAERQSEVGHLREGVDLWRRKLLPAREYEADQLATQLRIDLLDQQLHEIEEENAFAAMLADTAVERGEWSVDTPVETLTATRGSLNNAAAVGKRFDSLPLHHRKAIVAGLFPAIALLPATGTGRRVPNEERIALYLPSGEPWRQSKDENEPQVRVAG